jgi:hypothetical protein
MLVYTRCVVDDLAVPEDICEDFDGDRCGLERALVVSEDELDDEEEEDEEEERDLPFVPGVGGTEDDFCACACEEPRPEEPANKA